MRAKAIAADANDFSVEVIPATHGHGLIGWLMGPVAGYYLAAPNEPSVFITGDAVLTDTLREAVQRWHFVGSWGRIRIVFEETVESVCSFDSTLAPRRPQTA